MSWRAELHLHYLSRAGRSVAMHRHSGPLRVLQSLYPEGDAVCHNVMVHPPGGVVGGDERHIDVRVDAGAHGLVATLLHRRHQFAVFEAWVFKQTQAGVAVARDRHQRLIEFVRQ
mgnify:CR=1 FL=1